MSKITFEEITFNSLTHSVGARRYNLQRGKIVQYTENVHYCSVFGNLGFSIFQISINFA